MAVVLHTFLMLGSFSCIFLFAPIFGDQRADADWWCSQTPYPETCKHSLSHQNLNPNLAMQKSDFYKLALQLALKGAIDANGFVVSLGSKCRNDREKAAWADCLKLYNYTVFRLQQTISTTNSTQGDAQTWLSTALTNLETCRSGFIEVGVIDNILPLLSIENVSNLISNTLALNRVPHPVDGNQPEEFPSWAKSSNRKHGQGTPSSSLPVFQANIVVEKGGSGNRKTINEAIAAASQRRGDSRFVIYVKAGVYEEKVEIGSDLKNIMLVGDGIGKTIITNSLSVRGGSTTFNSATVAVFGDGFIGRDITFRNTAGPNNGQAVALLSMSDLSAFYHCSFEGYQDTLCVHSERQFFRECDIYGTVDFIFGNAAVVFQNCNIYVRKGHSTNTITAQGRSNPDQNTGISIQNCSVMAAADLAKGKQCPPTYLGRPWRLFSRTVFLESFLDKLVNPAGWLEWDGSSSLSHLYYAEYRNKGPRSITTHRVKWQGFHILTSPIEADPFTVENFISGKTWLPSTNIDFNPGL
ncbi:pectinesterase 2-like [Malania oleifera]|uniref:pectinesterase 2-like n=1 Tax=Malania oleifera TaxID=397392 RepID=UPI0025AE8EEA|nr:pectinesterase 2-like [Malania oleifera]